MTIQLFDYLGCFRTESSTDRHIIAAQVALTGTPYTMSQQLSLLRSFVENDCIPAEHVFAGQMEEIEARTGSRWTEIPDVMTELKAKARSLGLWNLFMPKVRQDCGQDSRQRNATTIQYRSI